MAIGHAARCSAGSTADAPRRRYVGNLGHVQDDESGLIYMRARYYEPSTGRFISEDMALDGKNWYAYCRNNPVGLADASGNQAEGVNAIFAVIDKLLRNRGAMSFSHAERLLDQIESAIKSYADRETMLANMDVKLAVANMNASNRPGITDWERSMYLDLADAWKGVAVKHSLNAKIAETFGQSFVRIARMLLELDE